MASESERRRYSRYPCAIRAVLQDPQRTARLVTADVSRHGAFLLTDEPRPERELVQLAIEVPERGALDVMATVAHRIVPAEPHGAPLSAAGMGPGMGVDFLALSRSAKDIWDDFVFGLRGGQPAQARGLEQQTPLAPVRRRHIRHASCFLVRLRDKERLRQLYTRDIGAGGIRLAMPAPESPTSAVELILVHPESEQEFQLGGTIKRVEPSNLAPRGDSVAIEFERLNTAREAALLAFIETGVNYLDDTTPLQEHEALVHAAANRGAQDSPDTLVTTGQTMLVSGDIQLAINAFRTALTLDPNCAAAHLELHRAHTRLGEARPAQTHWTAYQRLTASKSGGPPDRE